MRAKIISISKDDAYYEDRKELVGKTGEFFKDNDTGHGFYSGDFKSDEPIMITTPHGEPIVKNEIYFYKVKVKEI